MLNFINEFNSLTPIEKANFLSHQAANLTQSLFLEHDTQGIDFIIKNFSYICEHARNCSDCLTFLHSQGDVFAKLYLLIEFMGKDGIDEDFVNNLEILTEHAQRCLDKQVGDDLGPEGEKIVLDRLRAIIDRNELKAI